MRFTKVQTLLICERLLSLLLFLIPPVFANNDQPDSLALTTLSNSHASNEFPLKETTTTAIEANSLIIQLNNDNDNHRNLKQEFFIITRISADLTDLSVLHITLESEPELLELIPLDIILHVRINGQMIRHHFVKVSTNQIDLIFYPKEEKNQHELEFTINPLITFYQTRIFPSASLRILKEIEMSDYIQIPPKLILPVLSSDQTRFEWIVSVISILAGAILITSMLSIFVGGFSFWLIGIETLQQLGLLTTFIKIRPSPLQLKVSRVLNSVFLTLQQSNPTSNWELYPRFTEQHSNLDSILLAKGFHTNSFFYHGCIPFTLIAVFFCFLIIIQSMSKRNTSKQCLKNILNIFKTNIKSNLLGILIQFTFYAITFAALIQISSIRSFSQLSFSNYSEIAMSIISITIVIYYITRLANSKTQLIEQESPKKLQPRVDQIRSSSDNACFYQNIQKSEENLTHDMSTTKTTAGYLLDCSYSYSGLRLASDREQQEFLSCYPLLQVARKLLVLSLVIISKEQIKSYYWSFFALSLTCIANACCGYIEIVKMKGPFQSKKLNYFLGFCEILLILDTGFEVFSMIFEAANIEGVNRSNQSNELVGICIICVLSLGSLFAAIYFLYMKSRETPQTNITSVTFPKEKEVGEFLLTSNRLASDENSEQNSFFGFKFDESIGNAVGDDESTIISNSSQINNNNNNMFIPPISFQSTYFASPLQSVIEMSSNNSNNNMPPNTDQIIKDQQLNERLNKCSILIQKLQGIVDQSNYQVNQLKNEIPKLNRAIIQHSKIGEIDYYACLENRNINDFTSSEEEQVSCWTEGDDDDENETECQELSSGCSTESNRKIILDAEQSLESTSYEEPTLYAAGTAITSFLSENKRASLDRDSIKQQQIHSLLNESVDHFKQINDWKKNANIQHSSLLDYDIGDIQFDVTKGIGTTAVTTRSNKKLKSKYISNSLL